MRSRSRLGGLIPVVEKAAGELRRAHRTQRRRPLGADAGDGVWTARVERAAARAPEGMRDRAGDGWQQGPGRHVHARDRLQQRACVGMLRRVEDLLDRALLHHPPEVHHDDVARHLRDHAEVVRDEDDRRAVAALELTQQIQDLSLRRHVDRGGRLVGDQEARPARERHRDHRSLAQASGELPRIGVDALLWHRDAHAAEEVDGERARLGPGQARSARPPLPLVKLERLDDLLADRVDRAERGHRLLRDQRDLGAADRAQLGALRGEAGEVDGRPRALLKEDLTADDAPGRLDDLQDGLHGHALAASALADDPDHLARLHVEAHAVDRPHEPLVQEEVHPEVPDSKDRRRHWLYGSAASRRPSPTRLKARTERITTAPGTRSQGASATVWMFCASWSNTPQLIAGGRMPRPRNESDVSLMIIAGIARVLVAMMCDRNVGTMCRTMMRAWLAPASSAASTKSSSRSARNRPRTSRPSVVQPTSDRITVIAKNTCCGDQSRGSAAVSASQIGIVGNDCRSSISRWMTASARPP